MPTLRRGPPSVDGRQATAGRPITLSYTSVCFAIISYLISREVKSRRQRPEAHLRLPRSRKSAAYDWDRVRKMKEAGTERRRLALRQRHMMHHQDQTYDQPQFKALGRHGGDRQLQALRCERPRRIYVSASIVRSLATILSAQWRLGLELANIRRRVKRLTAGRQEVERFPI